MDNIPHIGLRCKRCNGSILWYERGGEKDASRYISKKNRKYAEELAYYTFGTEYLECLYKVDANLKLLQISYDELEQIKRKYFVEKEGFAELLSNGNVISNNRCAIEWAKEGCKELAFREDGKKFETLDGHFVRSKSEVMIADMLLEYGISYRYEDPIVISGKTLHPDFTIMRSSDSKLFYWEHFGMMDIASYSARTAEKIALYMANEIWPSDNFITSFENVDNPLSSTQIRNLIEMYSLAK